MVLLGLTGRRDIDRTLKPKPKARHFNELSTGQSNHMILGLVNCVPDYILLLALHTTEQVLFPGM